MAASAIVICNSTLHKLGESAIVTLDDANDRARALKLRYAPIRDLTLRSQRWNFALKRARLSADVTAPDFDYELRYALPSDCLQLVYINGTEFTPGMVDYNSRSYSTYQLEGGYILTDTAAPLDVRYVARIESEQLFDPLFDEALACRLAFDCCEKITQSTSKKQTAWQEYQMAIREAIRVNAIEAPMEEPVDGSWVLARL